MRITDFRQLEYAMCYFLVEAVCPICGRIMISTVPQARNILTFGCDQCGDIDDDILLNIEKQLSCFINAIQKADSSMEESNDY